MAKLLQGELKANPDWKVGIVVGRFNELVTGKLLSGAIDGLTRSGIPEDNIEITWVPGSFEIPATARQLAKKRDYTGIICLGAVIRGDTPHFDFVAAEASKGIASVGMEFDLPVIYGVLTTDNIDQAIERAGTKAGNKGHDAAVTLIEMASLYSKI